MGLGDITLTQYALVALSSVGAGVLGGIAGYGSGLLMIAVLVPLVGANVAIPVVSAAALLTNGTRLWAFRHELDPAKALIIMCCAVPTTAIGAWGFTQLSGKGALLLIGILLIVLVPLRRWLQRLEFVLSHRQLGTVAVGYGLITGAGSGAGVMLLSMLMWAGLAGSAVIATDAAVTFVLVLVKSITFHTFGSLPPSSIALALLIGVAGTPGAFFARWLSKRISLKQHTAILDAAVVLAGCVMIYGGLA